MDARRAARFRHLARAGVIAAGIAVVQLSMAVAPAAAATVVGSAAGNLGGCGGMDLVQLKSSGTSNYAIPTGGGTLTSWSTQVGTVTGQAALLVWRPTTTVNTLTLVGESPHVNLTASTMNTFTLASPIAVQAGDLLGLRVEAQSYCILDPGTGTIGFKTGTTPAVGQQEALTQDPIALTLDVSATLGTTTPTPPPSPSPGPSPDPKSKCHDKDSHHHTVEVQTGNHKGDKCHDPEDKTPKDHDGKTAKDE